MARVGYTRVSTTDQDLTVQREALERAGCTIIRAEKVSGTTTKGRTELQTVLDFARAGDTLVVTRIDRLARSLADLAKIGETLQAKGVALQATEQPVDLSSRMMLTGGWRRSSWCSSNLSCWAAAVAELAELAHCNQPSPDICHSTISKPHPSHGGQPQP